eukprot:scaffold10787_cov123-Isochrysis_galbana.AAC.4
MILPTTAAPATLLLLAAAAYLCRRVGHHTHPTRSPGRACLPGLVRLGEALACPSRLALSPPLPRPP